ncbi:MAG: proline dehydrogenase family protein [Armatimonadetes bacterium]|nr:proline dehydrogenase family protein [Armatimonadota bacterium]
MTFALTDEGIERGTQRFGRRILEISSKIASTSGRVNRFNQMVMDWVTRDEQLKTQLLRFIDVVPALRSPEEIATHIREYLLQPKLPIPDVGRVGLGVASSNPLASKAAATIVRANIVHLARRFIAGESISEVISSTRELRKNRYAATVDILGEATVSDEEATAYEQQYLNLLHNLVNETDHWKPNPLLDEVDGDPLPRTNISVKLSSLHPLIDPIAPSESSEAVRRRLRPILHQAVDRQAAVNIDMEQFELKSMTLRIFRDILAEAEFQKWKDCGIAIQAYLKETVSDLNDLIQWAKNRSAPITVRLVRGAYWDYETTIARQRHWPIPVFTEKWETDRSYETCLLMLLDAYPNVRTAVATHNIRSIALAMAIQQRLGLPENAVEFQMLYGMADPVKRAIADMGWRLRVYTPYGELIPGMAYLVRRLLENASNSSMVRLRWVEDRSAEEVLAPPERPSSETMSIEPENQSAHFSNEPDRDFSQPDLRNAFLNAIERVRGLLGQDYPLYIADQPVYTDDWLVSLDPSHNKAVVGRVAAAGTSHIEQAIQSATVALKSWRETEAIKRTEILHRAAELIRTRRDELSAWEVFEAGKQWREADADVTESIDYLEYYSQQMLNMETSETVESLPGEDNRIVYEPRGVVSVIPPWNFPLAILTSMTSAALVTGNTVVLKPAPQTPVIGALFAQIMGAAGLPAGVLNFVAGRNAVIGDYLVDHPNIAMVAFTGSRKTGERIYQRASLVHEGQNVLKHVIAEMGGKNATIIDSDADLDEVVSGVVDSAFGYQGQKCSACSRVICVGSVYEPFLKRLAEATKTLPIGPADDPYYRTGPVIDEVARDRILEAIDRGKKEAAIAIEVPATNMDEGYYVGPVIFRDVDPSSSIAQEEIFGPVLCVIPAKDLETAVRIANQSAYALTGGIYSRSPSHIDFVRRNFKVGNLYINRKITGALVGRQPFGGYKFSGTGSKAGGPDYLKHFMVMRVVTENTIRRGYAPPPKSLD